MSEQVPSYPTAAALALIEAELGAPASSLFELDASSEPIAAASLGQVYRCRLREGGAEVALKVQRPDMIRAVSLDLYLLRRYCICVEWFKVRVTQSHTWLKPNSNRHLWLSDAQCVHSSSLSVCVGSCVCGGPPCLCLDSVR